MGIGKEFVDTVQARVLGVIRSLQDPKQQVELAIKQLQDILADALNKTAEFAGETGLIHEKATYEQRKADDFGSSAKQAMAKANSEHASGDEREAAEWEEAARQAVAMKLQHQDLADSYSAQAASMDDQLIKLRKEIADLRLLITKLQARKERVVATQAQAAAFQRIGKVAQGASNLSDVLDMFDRMEDRATLQLKTAQAKVDLAKDPIADKLAALAYDSRVDDEMKKLRGGA